jgi:hypothetical protein
MRAEEMRPGFVEMAPGARGDRPDLLDRLNGWPGDTPRELVQGAVLGFLADRDVPHGAARVEDVLQLGRAIVLHLPGETPWEPTEQEIEDVDRFRRVVVEASKNAPRCLFIIGPRQRWIEPNGHVHRVHDLGVVVDSAHRLVAHDEALDPRNKGWREPGWHAFMQVVEAVVGSIPSRRGTPGHVWESR